MTIEEKFDCEYAGCRNPMLCLCNQECVGKTAVTDRPSHRLTKLESKSKHDMEIVVKCSCGEEFRGGKAWDEGEAHLIDVAKAKEAKP